MQNDEIKPGARCQAARVLFRSPRLVAALALLAAPGTWATTARGAGPADPLFRLVPPEASMVLAVEDLRTRARPIQESKLAADLQQLPLVARWLTSRRTDRLRRVRNKLEAGLGLPFATAVDEVLGDAFVLVLHSAPGGMVDQSSGLLLVRPRQAKLLERLVESRNTAQAKAGALIRDDLRKQGEVTYHSRLFRPGGWPSDHYVFLDDGTFAWSNSEATILEVIDRRAQIRPGWDTSPGFALVRRELPANAVASLYVAPAFVGRVLNTPEAASIRPVRFLRRLAAPYIRALVAIGFAVEWRDGPVLHSHEVVDAARLPGWMGSWMARPSGPSPLLGSVPDSAFALASARFDFAEAFRALRAAPKMNDRAWQSFERAASGLALGEPLEGLLERVDPHVVATVGGRAAPDARAWFAVAGGVAWLPSVGRPASPWMAADNAIRSGMALYALRSERRAWVEVREAAGRGITRLATDDGSLLATHSTPERTLLGNTPEAIARFADPGAPTTGRTTPVAALRAKYTADAETFAVVDVPGMIAAVEQVRGPMVVELARRAGRPVTDVERDLDEFLALARLFRGAILTSKADPGSGEVHRTAGLIAR